MKKGILLIALSLAVFGCSDDNAGNASGSDAIIGKWKLDSKTINATPVTLQPCETETFYTFKANGAKFSGEQHDYTATTSNCTVTNLSGRWGHENEAYYIVYNDNQVEIDWDSVTFSGTTMTTVQTNAVGTITETWTKQ